MYMHTHGCGVSMCVPVSMMCGHIHMRVYVWGVYGVRTCKGYRGNRLAVRNPTTVQLLSCRCFLLALNSPK